MSTEHSLSNRAGARPGFKVGDRVRMLGAYSGIAAGEVGEVLEGPHGQTGSLMTVRFTPVRRLEAFDYRFELVEEPAPDPWTPGEGWREIDKTERLTVPYVLHADGETSRYWVAEEPVPPLPTEPYTVIRASFRSGHVLELVRTVQDGWIDLNGGGYEDPLNSGSLTGFEVLTRPALEDDVLRDLLRVFAMRTWGTTLSAVSLQYGVDLLQGREPIVEQD